MCLGVETLAAVQLGLTAAGAVASHQAEQDAADKQARAIQQQRDAARMDAERQQQQQYEEAAASANAHALQAHKEMAAFDAISLEAGGGATATRGGVAMGIRQGQDLATINANARRAQVEIGMGDLAAGNKAQQQMASIKQPSLLQAGLTIAGAGVTYGNTMNKIRSATGKTAGAYAS